MTVSFSATTGPSIRAETIAPAPRPGILDGADRRFAAPIVMHSAAAQWTPDRNLRGVEHKHLGSFGVRRSGGRFTRLKPGATLPAHVQEDAEIRYLIHG